jgi:hypothetical protein
MLKILRCILVFHLAYSVGFTQLQQQNDFDYLATIIKNTYAGYNDKVKGNEFDILVNRVKQSSSKDTFALLSQLTYFFDEQHLKLYDEHISKQRINIVQCKKDSQNIRQYFRNKKPKYKYEGYWLSDFNNCVIAIKRVKSSPTVFHGYVVECNAKLPAGFCMFKMIQQNDGTFLTDYTDADFFFRVFLKGKFKDTNTLWVNSYDRFKRISTYVPDILVKKKAISYKPAFTKIDKKTVLLTMPSFRAWYVEVIDSLIKSNKSSIDSATTLIIDIRNNGGGTINNYLPLLPYIYTGPIVHTGTHQLYSDIYIKDYEDRMNRYLTKGDSTTAKIYIAYYDSVKAKRGKFDYAPPDTLANNLPTLSKPKNVAVIINNNCLSAAELMLLNFKQSKKVTIFGERTGGGVDYLDGLRPKLPSKKYSLFIASTKRALTEQQPSYDATGILPDVEISDDVTDWVIFVKKYYDEYKH